MVRDDTDFTISGGNQLKLSTTADYETKDSYEVCIRSTDQKGEFFDKTFTITVTDVDETPDPAELQLETISGVTGSEALLAAQVTAVGTYPIDSVASNTAKLPAMEMKLQMPYDQYNQYYYQNIEELACGTTYHYRAYASLLIHQITQR
jgi:hypothetical protein